MSLGALLGSNAFAVEFKDAQVAATEGRYDDVVAILTTILDRGDLQGYAEVVGYSNRGVAYSLLKQYPQAKRDLLHAIELDPDHLLTINHLGIMAQHIDGDAQAAAIWFRRAADQGYPSSQTNLATLYRDGKGVARDYTQAFRLYKLAADQNYVMSYVPLGELYMQGRGVNMDVKTDLEWLYKGVDEGVVSAHYHLGKAHERGWGQTQNYARAADEYYTAAMQGDGEAQNALGYLYRRGLGVKQDFTKAAEWYQLAADQQVVQATNRLAWLLATCPNQLVCNGALALELAQSAVEKERNATNLDSLAAAQARVGDYEVAIDSIEEILRMEGRNSRYASRLSFYQARRPYKL